jgi:5-methylcytosine-specific restriction endonuclease McrA
VGRIIAVMPLWKLQTVGGERLDFLYPNTDRGRRIQLRGEAVYCFRRFRDLVGELAEAAWVRFVRQLARNRELLGETTDVREFLFGVDRKAMDAFRPLLMGYQDGRCFYCDARIRAAAEVDHFIPWSRYPMDLGHNLVATDTRCNGDKTNRLAAVDHLRRWRERNDHTAFNAALESEGLPADGQLTQRVAFWAYSQAETAGARVWLHAGQELVALETSWHALLGARSSPAAMTR